ncbi:MAG: TrpR-related protein YerC/YecD [Clostridia bacterium]|nr:TrpR-related protein YerC/YecD [Clostridia bacterium]
MGIEEKHLVDFYKTVLKLKTVEDCKEFFNDVCTFKEVENMAQRIISAKLLMEGKTYEEIIKETDISSATLSRVSKCVKYGKGYNNILKDE